MALSPREAAELVHLIGQTREQELDCDGCASQLSEFAERHLAGQPIPEVLAAVEQHLKICGECRDEFELLRAALRDLGDAI
jgi:predicted anti-sigma-YlaC factor YlaD